MGTLRKWDATSKDIQDKCIHEVIARVEEIEGSAVGIIAAQDIIDIVTENLGPEIYNRAIKDAKILIEDRMSDVLVEIDMLNVQG